LLVAGLAAAGRPVIAINPTVVARYRGRISPAKKKSDRGDAMLLANILRTDGPLHRPMPATSHHALAIRELARAQRDAVRARQYHLNQLRAQLREHFPAAVTAWAHLNRGLARQEARAVLTEAPTPTLAAKLSRPHLRRILQQAGRIRLLDAESDRLHDLFHQPRLSQPAPIEKAMGHRAAAVLCMLDLACQLSDDLARQSAELFTAHPHAHIYTSFPGLGAMLGARLLGEIGDDPTRFAFARGLKSYAGATPLTWASGTSRVVRHRRFTNPILAASGHLWAFAALTRSPGARAHYDRRRETGDRHAAALRNLYARMLGQLHHCLAHNTEYDETKAFPQRE
jgi:transposase